MRAHAWLPMCSGRSVTHLGLIEVEARVPGAKIDDDDITLRQLGQLRKDIIPQRGIVAAEAPHMNLGPILQLELRPVLLQDVAVLRPLAPLVLTPDLGGCLIPVLAAAVNCNGRQQARQRIVHLPGQRIPNHDDLASLHAPAGGTPSMLSKSWQQRLHF